MLRRTLARTLFALAAANAALTGCQSKSQPKGVATVDQEGQSISAEEAPTQLQGETEMKEDKSLHGASKGTGSAVGRGAPAGVLAQPRVPHDPSPGSGEAYQDHGANAWTDSATDRLSTFAVDVDTASYTIARRKLTEGGLPPAASVRVEEFVNYFKYAYPEPDGSRPFSVHVDTAPSPFNSGRQIVRVGVSTKAKSIAERKPAHLVFLVDVSGSMQSPDKLDLAKRSLRILVDNLGEDDTVALVTYAGSTRVVLEPVGLDHKREILDAIENLTAGGSTAMGSGIELAYQEAVKGLTGDAVSRVIVLSDGDANVGTNVTHEQILATITDKVKEGVTLSTIGFGMGNYKDTMMEQLANKGNGNNFYIDGISQAKRVFQEQLGSTLEVVAKDVKLQVDFDPRVVARYRLIGYENRDIADASFRDDAVDAGEIGAGHQVTALYEIEPVSTMTADVTPSDFCTVRVRHMEPRGVAATEAAFTFDPANAAARFDGAAADLRFAFAAAAFADVLRGGEDAEHWGLSEIRAIAAAAAGNDADRLELVALIDRAIALKAGPTAMATP